MTRVEQLAFCKKCTNRKMDAQQGIVCSLTGKVADFKGECQSFNLDKTIKHSLNGDINNGMPIEESIMSSEGRITRSTFWIRWLIIFIANVFIRLAMFSTRDKTIIILFFLIMLVLSVFMIIQTIKRMHDVGKSGWYSIVPFYSLILALTDGTKGINKYGRDPKNRKTTCPNCQIENEPGIFVCERCNSKLINNPSAQTDDNRKQRDLYILVFIIIGAGSTLVRFVMETLISHSYDGIWRYIHIGFNIIYAFSLIILSLAIQKEKYKTIGIVLASIWAIYILYSNIIWVINI